MRSLTVRPRKSAIPNSVTMMPASLRAKVTGPPILATIRLCFPAVEGSAMIGNPPLDKWAPRMKSTAPPTAPM
ncbi:hypothetical protein D3C76_1723510 [compost metagenome]